MKIFTLIFLLVFNFVLAQNKDSLAIAKEKKLRVVTAANKENKSKANYNIGNTQFKKNKTEEAKVSFANNAEKATSKIEKQQNYHNLGNAFMAEKNYEKAVEAYKKALRNNPTDEQTRYNLALAKQKLKENPPKKKDKKKEKDKDKNKDKKKDKNKPKPKQQKQPSAEKKQQVENVLNAIAKAEKATQEKVNKSKNKNTTTIVEKDW